MRQAYIEDYWRYAKEIQHRINGVVEIEQNNGIKNSIEGLFAIVGANGAGKSSFIDFLTNSDYSRIGFLPQEIRLHDGTVISIPDGTLRAHIIEPSAELKIGNVQLLQFKTTFGQEELAIIPKNDLDFLYYTLGEIYNNIAIENVCVGDDKYFPRFVFTRDEFDYDNETLSFGEQIVAYIYWSIINLEHDTRLCFIEEPETGLSPAVQKRLADMLAYLSKKKQIQIFITTHSPFITSKIGYENTIVMQKHVMAEWVNATEANCIEELGLSPICKNIFLVEDRFAKMLLDYILCIYACDIKKSSEIISLGGESDIYAVISRINDKCTQIGHKGIVDGDLRDDIRYRGAGFIFLPGDVAPEILLFNFIQEYSEQYADELKVDQRIMLHNIRKCIPNGHHDFFLHLSRKFGHETDHKFVDAALSTWLKFYYKRNEIWELLSSIDPGFNKEFYETTDKRITDG